MSGERLLVVDDDPTSCEAVAEGLRAEGFDVATAFGGDEALARIRERAFDIVLSDVRMRDLDGLTLLQTLRRETPDVCVILMTAFANVEVRFRPVGQPGAPVSWRNPDSGRYGTIVPGPQYQQAGRNCRSYTHTIYIDGQPQTARGTACRNPDGTWTAVG